MTRKHLLAAAALALPTLMPLTGCQPQGELNQYRTQYRTAQDQILDLQARLADKDRQLEILRGARNPNDELKSELNSAEASRAELQAEILRLQDLVDRAGSTPIPVELADELEKLAAANPELMSYDSATGAIRFRSDVTFALGKADVRSAAVPIINKLAKVLNAPVADDYEVRVAGHTDNVPMKNALNRQQYGDNWGLSTARAISVMKAFAAAGIPEARMSVAGYGEYRPVEPNGDKGSARNRRVEIYLVPLPSALSSKSPAATAEDAAAAPASPPEASGEDNGNVSELIDVAPVPEDEAPEMFK